MSDEIKQNEISKEVEYENLMKPFRDKKKSLLISNFILILCNIKFLDRLANGRKIDIKDLKKVIGVGFFSAFSWIFILVGYNYVFLKFIVKVNPYDFLKKKKQLEESMIEETKYDFHTLIDMMDNENEKKI
jgi:hypothetical protein